MKAHHVRVDYLKTSFGLYQLTIRPYLWAATESSSNNARLLMHERCQLSSFL